MNILKELLVKKKADILGIWLHLILETYPAELSKRLIREKDRFTNPVGYILSQETEALYEGLLKETEIEKLSDHLDRILRIRSVQDFSPSRAVVFVLLLKKAIRETITRHKMELPLGEEWLDLESRIDQLSLKAFDLFLECREKVYEIRMDEIKKERDRILKLLERTR